MWKKITSIIQVLLDLVCSSSHSHTLAWHIKIQAVQQVGTQSVDDLAESLEKGPLIRWLAPTKWYIVGQKNLTIQPNMHVQLHL